MKIHKTAKLILCSQLPIITIALVALLISYLTDRKIDPLLANHTYPAHLEYIMASLAIMLGGCVLAELAERDREQK